MVALWLARDAHHQECVEQLRDLAPPLLTCWPVITEAAWLLRRHPAALQQLFKGFETGLLRVAELDERAAGWVGGFLSRYRSVGAKVADAALVYLAEREGIDTVFTLDRRDFSVYRVKGARALRLLP